MNGDPGLAPSPWVSIELRDEGVYVDGTPVEAIGSLEDRYLAALQRVADRVAVPLGRRVGVSVADGRGVTHLAIHPDGTAESIEDLVREATGAEVAAAPRVQTEGRGAEPAAAPPERPRGRVVGGHLRRPLLVTGTAVLGVSVVVGALQALGAATDRAATSIENGASPSAGTDPSRAAMTTAPTATATRWEDRSVTLVADVSVPGRGRLVLLLGADGPRVRATARVVAADGSVLVRRVVLRGGGERVVFRDLPGGEATWRVTARGAKPLRGTVLVRPLPPPPAPPEPPAPSATTAPAPSGPTSQPGGRGDGGRGPGSGQGDAAPVIPIDPDDP